MTALLVLTHCPDGTCAEAIASGLLAARLAACVSIQAPCRSHYRWQGKLEVAEEIPLLIKTRRECYSAVQEMITALHPYSVPEIIALPVIEGLPAYLDWLMAETTPEAL